MFDLNVCITGGSGFIGRHLCRELTEKGCRVVVYDLNPPAQADDAGVIYVEGDIRDQDRLTQVLREYDIHVLIHLAAVSTIQQGEVNFAETASVNIGGAHSLMKAARDYGRLHLLLLVSSGKVYGKLCGNASRETDPREPLDSTYDETMSNADAIVRWYAQIDNLPAVVLRLCNIYGPGDPNLSRIVPRSIHRLLEERKPCILRKYEDAQGNLQEYYREFLYIGDFCRAVVRIMELRETSGDRAFSRHYGEAYNLSAEPCIPMSQVLQTIQDACGVQLIPIQETRQDIPEIGVQHMDCTKAREAFGFRPETSFEEGIRLTVQAWNAAKHRE